MPLQGDRINRSRQNLVCVHKLRICTRMPNFALEPCPVLSDFLLSSFFPFFLIFFSLFLPRLLSLPLSYLVFLPFPSFALFSFHAISSHTFFCLDHPSFTTFFPSSLLPLLPFPFPLGNGRLYWCQIVWDFLCDKL